MWFVNGDWRMPPGQGSYGVFEFAKRCNECASMLQLVTFVTIATGWWLQLSLAPKTKLHWAGLLFPPALIGLHRGNKNSHWIYSQACIARGSTHSEMIFLGFSLSPQPTGKTKRKYCLLLFVSFEYVSMRWWSNNFCGIISEYWVYGVYEYMFPFFKWSNNFVGLWSHSRGLPLDLPLCKFGSRGEELSHTE